MDKKPLCLVCLNIIAIQLEYNLKRQYTMNYLLKYESCIGDRCQKKMF